MHDLVGGVDSSWANATRDRRQEILAMIQRQGKVTIQQLADHFHLSPVSIRKDLEQLEMYTEGQIKRYRGGAVLNPIPLFELDFHVREEELRQEKMAIAEVAAQMVSPGEVVMLSAGTTTTFIARFLAQKGGVTVVTNGINIAAELAGRSQLTVVMIGGLVPEKSYATVGPLAHDYLQRITADIAFIGVAGIDPDVGFTTPYMLEAETYTTMIRTAKKSVVVADHTKLNRRSLSIIAPLLGVNQLIVDNGADAGIVQELQIRGLQVTVASPEAEGGETL